MNRRLFTASMATLGAGTIISLWPEGGQETAAVVPVSSKDAQEDLLGRLGRISEWTRVESEGPEKLSLSCGSSDLQAWSRLSEHLGGKRRIWAGGNVMSFQWEGRAVEIKLLSTIA
jgi:hypothetical protein